MICGYGASASHASDESRLLTQSQLRRRLELERMRSDRSGIPFTLLRLTLRPDEAGAANRRLLAAKVEQRVREIDEIGDWDGGSLAVLLPYTPAAGAWILAADIRRITGLSEPAMTCDVHEYPFLPRDAHGSSSGFRRNGHSVEAPAAVQPTQPMLFSVQPLPLGKRLFDVFVAAIGLVLVAPILLLAALAVRWSSRGPFLFRQQRSGLGGREFTIFKLRTMHVGAERRQEELMVLNEQDGPAFKIAKDPRVTAVGQFLRTTCIDELPQLWNVLRGEMSLVGPRPLWVVEQNKCEAWHYGRLTVPPGLTCTWQVHGRQGVTFNEWMRMDLRYIRERTFMNDLRLLSQTAKSILFHQAWAWTGLRRSAYDGVSTRFLRQHDRLARLAMAPTGKHPVRGPREQLRRLAVQAAVPLDCLFGPLGRDGFGILMYHRVTPVPPGVAAPTWNVPPRQFREQITGLLRRGFEAWSLRRVLQCRVDGTPVPRRIFVVTFDDAYECVYSHAWPVLRELGVPATVFVPTAYLDSREPFPYDDWSDAGSHRVPPESWRLMSTAQCRELLDGGLVDVGTHTHTHTPGELRNRTLDLRDELRLSCDLLRKRFGLDEVAFAFPYGTRSDGFSGPEMSAAAREAGVICALTTESDLVRPGDDPFDWGRFTAESWDTSATLAAKLDGWENLARRAWRGIRTVGLRREAKRSALFPTEAAE